MDKTLEQIKQENKELKARLYENTRLLIKIKGAMFLRGVHFHSVSDLTIREAIDKTLDLLVEYILEVEANA